MKATDQIKHAAFEKTLDYLLEDPERNATKIMDMLDKVAPADLFPSQRTAFRNAIDQQSNWHQLITRVLELNPAMRNDFIKTFLVDGNLMAWPKQETMREKHRCNVPGPSSWILRAPATCTAPVVGPPSTVTRKTSPTTNWTPLSAKHRARHLRVHLHGRRAARAQAGSHRAL